MQCIYAYMEPGKHIYRPYIYVFHVYLYLFVQFSCWIYANECNFMQMYAPLHINSVVTEPCGGYFQWLKKACRVGSAVLDMLTGGAASHISIHISFHAWPPQPLLQSSQCFLSAQMAAKGAVMQLTKDNFIRKPPIAGNTSNFWACRNL